MGEPESLNGLDRLSETSTGKAKQWLAVVRELMQARDERSALRLAVDDLRVEIDRGRHEDREAAERRIVRLESRMTEGFDRIRADLNLSRRATLNDTEDLRDRVRVFEALRQEGRNAGRREAGVWGGLGVLLAALISALVSRSGAGLPW
jgi:hypothetical protein